MSLAHVATPTPIAAVAPASDFARELARIDATIANARGDVLVAPTDTEAVTIEAFFVSQGGGLNTFQFIGAALER